MKQFIFLGFLFAISSCYSQGLVDNSESPYAQLKSVALDDVIWTDGFWKQQFDIEKEETLPYMWELYHDAEVTHAYRNFEIAAGKMEGTHDGPSFHDGDFYKIMEGMAAMYAITKDEQLNQQLDEAIALIAEAQREDGYLHTPVLIEDRWGTLGEEYLQQQLGFEKYNMGHLMTAAAIHHRATGKRNFLDVAIGVTDFLYDFYKNASPELARNAICPSHYMGVIEMYRTTNDPRYLELANNLINIRGTTEDGTDDNQDRIPFREQTTAMGHAVRANYLYAGVADLYAETGEEKLLENLKSIWDDVVYRKMYITGGHGSLYDGVSPDGTVYNPSIVQKIHQAYGRPYQLPNATAHTETCANIGHVLWNWRMFQITKEAKYMDVLELSLYNSVLSGISLQGKEFCYNNPLNVSEDLPFEQRWGSKREGYISLSNCCAPNVTRTLAEINNYAYSLGENEIFVNIFGSNEFSTTTENGKEIQITQTTNYPWEGDIMIELNEIPQDFSINLRIPHWARSASVKINGEEIQEKITTGEYLQLSRAWKKGDQIQLTLPMHPELMEANPLVEETKNQVAMKRGPLVYCLETKDLPENTSINQVLLDITSDFTTEEMVIDERTLTAVKANAFIKSNNWENSLYQPMNKQLKHNFEITLIPYFAWGNRDFKEMTVWLRY